MADLTNAIQSNATEDVLRQKLAAVRAARAQAKVALEKAQKDLQSVVTLRQEAILLVQLDLLE